MFYDITFNYYNIIHSFVGVLDIQAKLGGMCAFTKMPCDNIFISIFPQVSLFANKTVHKIIAICQASDPTSLNI